MFCITAREEIERFKDFRAKTYNERIYESSESSEIMLVNYENV